MLPTNKQTIERIERIIGAGLEQEIFQSVADPNVVRALKARFTSTENGDLPKKNMTKAVHLAVEDFYIKRLNEKDVYETLLTRLGKLDGVDQSKISEFVSEYIVFTSSFRMQIGFSISFLTISNDEGYFRWQHRRRDAGEKYASFGFVFDYGNRLYLSGMGPNFTRPMLIERRPNEIFDRKNSSIRGILMSVTEKQELYSANFFAVSREHASYDVYKILLDDGSSENSKRASAADEVNRNLSSTASSKSIIILNRHY